MKFHIYHKIHQIHRSNLEKSWSRIQKTKDILRRDMDKKDYVKILQKYNMNNFS